MRSVSGRLIALEGLDQSGKQTQARRLRTRLEGAGCRLASLTFPCYETPIAQEIARALRGGHEYAPDVLQLLFIANRYEYRQTILGWIEDGRIVLCDRYLASSIAYGEAQGIDPSWLAVVQAHLPPPDVTIFIDIAPATAASRKAADRDRFERDLALLERVRSSYLRQAADPTWARVDGERDIAAIEEEIAAVIAARLGLPSAP